MSHECCKKDVCSTCGTCGCQCHATHFEGREDFAAELLHLADDAWMELLKEKIKEQILKKNGKQLDKLAALVSNANHSRWQHKMGEQGAKQELRKDLGSLFHNG